MHKERIEINNGKVFIIQEREQERIQNGIGSRLRIGLE